MTKKLTQAEAADLYNTRTRVAAIKDKPVLVHAVSGEYHYVTVVSNENGELITENAGSTSVGYIVRQVIIGNQGKKYTNEYVIRDADELAKRYDLSADQDGVPEGWARYVPKAGAAKQVVQVHETIEFPDPWAGNPFILQDGGFLVDNGDGQVYGINPVEFHATHRVLPFINLTPHTVGVLDTDGETVVEVPPCGTLARVDYTDILAGHVYGDNVHGGERIAAFSSVVREYGEVTGLPPEGSLCVVSMPVAERCAGRVGVYYPDSGRDCIRDESGQIKAVRRLVKAGAKETLGLDEEQIEALAMEAGFDVDDGEVLGGRAGSLQRFAKLIERAIRA